MKPLDTYTDLKNFFEWARKEGAHKIQVGDIQVEFVPDLGLNRPVSEPAIPGTTAQGGKEGSEDVEEEVVFHSSDK